MGAIEVSAGLGYAPDLRSHKGGHAPLCPPYCLKARRADKAQRVRRFITV